MWKIFLNKVKILSIKIPQIKRLSIHLLNELKTLVYKCLKLSLQKSLCVMLSY